MSCVHAVDHVLLMGWLTAGGPTSPSLAWCTSCGALAMKPAGLPIKQGARAWVNRAFGSPYWNGGSEFIGRWITPEQARAKITKGAFSDA